jgi:glucokinase
MILGGDIGGTKTLLALFSLDSKDFKPIFQKHYSNVHYTSLHEIIVEFLEENGIKPRLACFGIAGPIENGVCNATNLPWVIDSQKIKVQFQLEQVVLINDLEANAYGIEALEPKDIYVLREGNKRVGKNRALISAGTGLGEAPIFFDGKSYIPSASEGGHCDFAPRNEDEIELLRFLQVKYGGHVSYERLVSGMGLVNIYEFLIQSNRYKESKVVMEAMQSDDRAEVITGFAKTRKCEACIKSVSWFLSIYGSEAGNLALKTLSLSGLYVGGGIAPKLLEQIKVSDFLHTFSSKGRFKPLLDSIPVYIILHQDTALLGTFLKAQICFSS